MKRNTLITILAIIISIIIVGVIFLITSCSHSDDDNKEQTKVQGVTNENNTEENKKLITVEVNGTTYTDLEKLSAEQRAVQNQYIKLLSRCIQQTSTGIKAKTANIKNIEPNNDVIVTVTYENGTTKDFIVTYDATKYHRFLRCVPMEEHEHIMSGADSG